MIVFSHLWQKSCDFFSNYNIKALIIFLKISIIHKKSQTPNTISLLSSQSVHSISITNQGILPRLFVPKLLIQSQTVFAYQFSSVAQGYPTLCGLMDCSTPGFPVHHQLLELTQTHVHWVSDAIQPSHLLLSPCLPPSIFPSIRAFSSESVLWVRWPKYWSFSFRISPSNEYSGLISFRVNCFDLLAVHRTLQHHSSPTSQFESINSSLLSLLYSPTLTSVHEYWKNHSFD